MQLLDFIPDLLCCKTELHIQKALSKRDDGFFDSAVIHQRHP